MKKMIALLASLTLLGNCGMVYPTSANALESIGLIDYQSQAELENAELPDLDAKHTQVKENDFTFNVYEDFAYIAKYDDRTVEEITIPAEINGIKVIGISDDVFGFCHNLKKIVFSDNLKYFDWFDFVAQSVSVNSGNTEEILPVLETIEVPETNPYYTVEDGMLYSKDMKTLIGCPPLKPMEELKISEKTERINDYAFVGNLYLKKAVIPDNVKHINNSAFVVCEKLESVELPEAIRNISMDTFYLCKSLKDVKFNGTIEKIGTGAFNGCIALTEFDIPDSVYYIGKDAFEDSGCISVKDGIHYVDNWAVGSDEDIVNAIVENGTVGISEMSFYFRNKIELLEIPETVTNLGVALLSRTEMPSFVKYGSSYINSKTLVSAKGSSDFYIYDKDCDIFDSEKTIPAKYTIGYDIEKTYDVTIHGYAGSTAQAYAEKYNRKFEVIEDSSEFEKGDANGDGVFTIADAVIVQKYILGNKIEIADIDSVDLCKDGKIDVFDLCLIRENLVK